ASIFVLNGSEPGGRAPDCLVFAIDAGRVERDEDRPGPVDVVHAPASVPAAVFFLVVAQEVETMRQRSSVPGAELSDHARAGRGAMGGRWIEQCTVIGERNVVQVIARIARIERAPAFIGALQTGYPFVTAVDGPAEVWLPTHHAAARESIHRHHHDGGVVE